LRVWGVGFGVQGLSLRREGGVHIRQSRPDSGVGVQAKANKNFQVVPSSLGSGIESTETCAAVPRRARI